MNLWGHRFSPKCQPKTLRISALPSNKLPGQKNFFGWHFGRNDDLINSFWILMTFSISKGVNGGWAGWAIAHPVLGEIEVATRQWRQPAVLPSLPDLGSYWRPWTIYRRAWRFLNIVRINLILLGLMISLGFSNDDWRTKISAAIEFHCV